MDFQESEEVLVSECIYFSKKDSKYHEKLHYCIGLHLFFYKLKPSFVTKSNFSDILRRNDHLRVTRMNETIEMYVKKCDEEMVKRRREKQKKKKRCTMEKVRVITNRHKQDQFCQEDKRDWKNISPKVRPFHQM